MAKPIIPKPDSSAAADVASQLSETDKPEAEGLSAVSSASDLTPEERRAKRRAEFESQLSAVQLQIAELQRDEAMLIAQIDLMTEADEGGVSPHKTTLDIQAYLKRQQEVRIERGQRLARLADLGIEPEDLMGKLPVDRKGRRRQQFVTV